MTVTGGQYRLPFGHQPAFDLMAWVSYRSGTDGKPRDIVLGRLALRVHERSSVLLVPMGDGKAYTRLRNQMERLFNCQRLS